MRRRLRRKHFRHFSDQSDYVALIGNPNCGKTAIFNHLTGMHQKVSNYPGITVERKLGRLKKEHSSDCFILDLPGTYSITPESVDERVVAEQVMDWIHGINRPSVIISVVDATNLSRNLYLTSQLLDLGIPIILALNMMDKVLDKVSLPDLTELKEKFGFSAVVPMSALEGWGIEELNVSIKNALKKPKPLKTKKLFESYPEIHGLLSPLTNYLINNFDYSPRVARVQALRLITRQSAVDLYRKPHVGRHDFSDNIVEEIEVLREEAVKNIQRAGLNHRTLEATIRYNWIDKLLTQSKQQTVEQLQNRSRSEKIDQVMTHPFFGIIIFISLLIFIFQSIFTWSNYPMDWIDAGIASFGEWILNTMSPGLLRDLIVEGVNEGWGKNILHSKSLEIASSGKGVKIKLKFDKSFPLVC